MRKLFLYELKRAYKPYVTELLFIAGLIFSRLDHDIAVFPSSSGFQITTLILISVSRKIGLYGLVILPLVGIIIGSSISKDIEDNQILLTLMLANSRVKAIIYRFIALVIFYGTLISIPLGVNFLSLLLPSQVILPIFFIVYCYFLSVSLFSSSIAIITRSSLISSVFLILILYSPTFYFMLQPIYNKTFLLYFLLGFLPTTGLYGFALGLGEIDSIYAFYYGISFLVILSVLLFLLSLIMLKIYDLVM
ncbi:MAG: hypothetical protein ACP5GU_03140 [Thermoprotei archaeon]|jgi:hypothetical protein